MWDKWTARDCVRHTRERCFIITNINVERVQYSEIPRTPPHTPVSSHSVPVMLHGSQHLQSREQIPEPRRRSLSRSEGWELTEFPKKSQGRERKGER